MDSEITDSAVADRPDLKTCPFRRVTLRQAEITSLSGATTSIAVAVPASATVTLSAVTFSVGPSIRISSAPVPTLFPDSLPTSALAMSKLSVSSAPDTEMPSA